MKVHRPELLLCALLGGVLCEFANAYWPLQPGRAVQARLWPGLLSLMCVVRAFTARRTVGGPGQGPREPEARRWGLWLVHGGVRLVFAVGLLAIITWMHAASYITAAITSPRPTVVGMAAGSVTLVVCGWLLWRRPAVRPVVTGLVDALVGEATP